MQCPICLGIPLKPIIMACCRNQFCSICISQWTQIRNVCPLCCTQLQINQTNKIHKKVSAQSFDDGSLIIETQISQLKSRIRYIEKRINAKRQQFKNMKSSISASLIRFLQKQIQRVKTLQIQIDKYHALMNRVKVIQNIQIQAQIIFYIEDSLQNNCIVFEESYGQFEYYEEQNDETQNSYQQFQNFAINQRKGSSKSTKFRIFNTQSINQKKGSKSIRNS